MPHLSRRQFLRTTSVGAAATGVLAVSGATLFDSASRAGATPLAADASTATPHLEGSDIFAHVINAKTGEMTIFVGTTAVSYTNRDLAQALLQAAQ
jgi:nitrous oxide reductase